MRVSRIFCGLGLAVALVLTVSAIYVSAQSTTEIVTHLKYPDSTLDLSTLQKNEDGDPIFPRSIVTDIPKPDKPYPYALLLAENSCKMRKQFSNVRKFVESELPYYYNIKTKLTGGLPRLRFFQDKADWEHNTVDPHEMTLEQMKELLQKLREDPNYNAPKHSTIEVQLSQETTEEDLKELLQKLGVERDLVFHKERLPVIYEEDDDRPNNKQFDVDAIIKEVDPEAGPVELSPEARAQAEEMMRKEAEERAKRYAQAAAAESHKTEL